MIEEDNLQFEDALELVRWLDEITTSQTTILLKTELTTVIFELHVNNELMYEIAIDVYEEPSSSWLKIYEPATNNDIYALSAR